MFYIKKISKKFLNIKFIFVVLFTFLGLLLIFSSECYAVVDVNSLSFEYNGVTYDLNNLDSSVPNPNYTNYDYVSVDLSNLSSSNYVRLFLHNSVGFIDTHYTGLVNLRINSPFRYITRLRYDVQTCKFYVDGSSGSNFVNSSNNSSYTSVLSDYYDLSFLESNVVTNYSLNYNGSSVSFIPFQSSEPEVIYPEFSTTLQDLQTLNFDNLCFATNDFYQDDLQLKVFDFSISNLEAKKIFDINTNSKYYQSRISSGNAIYFIPIEDLSIKFEIGNEYCFVISTIEEPRGRNRRNCSDKCFFYRFS